MNNNSKFELCLYQGVSQIGKQHNDWIVLGYARHSKSRDDGYNKVKYWRCRCQGCGEEFEVIADNVVRGLSKGCVSCSGKKNEGSGNPFWKGCGDIPSSLWTRYKHGAKQRGISFKLSLKDMRGQWERQNGICPLTGMKLVMLASNSLDGRKLGRYLDDTPVASLDRIDNMKGYEVGNIIWVHKTANTMRNAFDMRLFVSMCDLIAKNGKSWCDVNLKGV